MARVFCCVSVLIIFCLWRLSLARERESERGHVRGGGRAEGSQGECWKSILFLR